MKVLITTIGSAGDIHPYLAIGKQLVSRGHQVEMLVNPHYQARVERQGLAFRSLGTAEQLMQVLHHPSLARQNRSPGLIIRELIGQTIAPTIDGMLASLREFKPDIVLRHHISLGSRWICQRERVPYLTGVLSPVFWFNRHDPCVHRSYQFENAPAWLMRLRLKLGKWIMRWMFDRPVNKARLARGFAASRDNFFSEIFDAPAVLGLWSRTFRDLLPDDPSQCRVCGFCAFDDAEGRGCPPDVRAWLDECQQACDPPIIFTLGTSVVHHHNGFYQHAADACERLGRRGLLLVGKDEYAPPRLSPRVRAFTYAPFAAVFPHASAIVHHGGVGTTGQALTCGKPTLIIPFANDEFDNARRARALGTSMTLHANHLNARHLQEALRALLENQSVADRARATSVSMQSDDGPGTACREIEALIGRNLPQPPTEKRASAPA